MRKKNNVKRTLQSTSAGWKRFANNAKSECAIDVVPIHATVVAIEAGTDAEDLGRGQTVEITDVKPCALLLIFVLVSTQEKFPLLFQGEYFSCPPFKKIPFSDVS